MRYQNAGGLYAREFGKNGQELRVRVDGQLTFNNSYAMIDEAIHGNGIAYAPPRFQGCDQVDASTAVIAFTSTLISA
jgi:hypothetical protein